MKPNRRAILDMIAKCEGTDGPDGYRMLFGGHLFDSFAAHPNVRQAFKQTDGTTAYTTAAGRYQFIFRTWERDAEAIGAPDFSPAWQDEAALYEIEQAGALDDVDAGRLQAAIDKISGIWASLPSSKYPQPKRTTEFARLAFVNAGGVLA